MARYVVTTSVKDWFVKPYFFRPDEICDYSNPTHGEKRTCLRTAAGECPKVILNQKSTFDRTASQLHNHALFQNDHNFNVPISGSGSGVNILRSKGKTFRDYFTENLSQFDPDPMTPSGWLMEGKWTSIKTRRSFQLDVKSIERCLAKKQLHFFGDSTARNIHNYFIQILKLRDFGLDNSIAWTRGRDAVSKKLNMTMQFRSHGFPLHNPGPEDARPYMSDSFDAVREGSNRIIVMFAIGYHFHNFDADVYLRRLKIN